MQFNDQDREAFNAMVSVMAGHIGDADRSRWERWDWPSPNVCGGNAEFDTLKAWQRDLTRELQAGEGQEARKRVAREMVRRMCRRYGSDPVTGVWARILWRVVVDGDACAERVAA